MNNLNPSRNLAARARAGWSSALLLAAVLVLPALVQAQVNYAVSGYTAYVAISPHASGDVVITNIYDGYPVTSIGTHAFEHDNITSVTIPNSVTSIGHYAFAYCSSLTSFTVDASNPAYSSMNGVLFDKAQATLVQFPGGLGGSYTIPNSVTSIGFEAFAFCTSLTSVTIGNGLTNIGNEAFDDCTSLTSFTVDASSPTYSSMNGVLFDKAQATLVQFPGGLGGSYPIPNSVTSIGPNAFQFCRSLTSVTIPNGVTSIGDNAFYDCTSLTSVTIPNSVTIIGNEAFFDCYGLTSLTIGNGVTSIGGFAFGSCTHLTSMTIPNSVTSIGEGAFDGCTSLTSVTIPNSVTSIGDYAFYDCTSLTSVTIGNGVTSIGYDAFYDCTSLTSVTIPNSVTSIGNGAFYECTSLTNIAVDAANPAYSSLGGVLFDKAQATLLQFPGALGGSYTIPNSVTSIGSFAFENCTSLTSVTIPNSVTSIGAGAFADTFMTSVYFTGNAPSPTNDSSVFTDYPYSDPATVYYLPGTTGWGAMFDGLPTAPWFLPNPLILNHGPGFGMQPGGFGFTISWATNASVVVEAATNLANPVWFPLSTSPLTGGTSHFSDPQWTNYPGRFYRVTSKSTPTFPGFTGNMDVDMYNAAVADGTANGGVPAVMLTENGGPFRVTALGTYSNEVCFYYGSCVFATIVGTTSCSSTTLPSGSLVIQFGTAVVCGGDTYYGY